MPNTIHGLVFLRLHSLQGHTYEGGILHYFLSWLSIPSSRQVVSPDLRENRQISQNRQIFTKSCRLSQKMQIFANCANLPKMQIFRKDLQFLRKKLGGFAKIVKFTAKIVRFSEFSRVRPKPNRVNIAHRFAATFLGFRV